MSVFHSDFSKFWWFGPQGLAGLAGRSVGSCDRQRHDFDRLNFDTRGSDAISLGGEEEKKKSALYLLLLFPLSFRFLSLASMLSRAQKKCLEGEGRNFKGNWIR